jgi:hypothetical protein
MTLLAAGSVFLAATALADGVLEIPGGAAAPGSLAVASWSVGAADATGAPATGRQASPVAPKVGDEVTLTVRYREAPMASNMGKSQTAGRVAGDCVKGQHIKEATLKIDGRTYVLGDLVVTSCDTAAAAKGDPLKGMLKGHVTLIK